MDPYITLSIIPIFIWYFQNHIKYNEVILLSFLIFLIFFIGFRFRVGPDIETLFYVYDDNIIKKKPGVSLEYGSMLLMTLFKELKLNFFHLQGLLTFISLSIFFYISLTQKDKWFLISLATPAFFFIIGINSTRQFLTISLFFLFIYLNTKNLTLKSLFIFFIGASLHKSFIILTLPLLIFLLLIKLINILKKNIIYIAPIFISIIFIVLILFNDLLIHYMTTLIGYALAVYLALDLYSDGYFIRLIFFSPLLLMGAIIFKFNKNIFTRGILIYFFFFIFGTFLLSIVSTTLADRFNFYLYAFMFFIILKFIELPQEVIKIKNLKLLFILYNFIFMIIWLNFANMSMHWYPYKNYYLIEKFSPVDMN